MQSSDTCRVHEIESVHEYLQVQRKNVSTFEKHSLSFILAGRSVCFCHIVSILTVCCLDDDDDDSDEGEQDEVGDEEQQKSRTVPTVGPQFSLSVSAICDHKGSIGTV